MRLPFILFRDDLAGHSRLFAHPREVLAADTPGDFFAALELAEAARRSGKWVAGYFSYESGFLFEPKLAAQVPAGRRLPYLLLGIFDAPSDGALAGQALPPDIAPIAAARPRWSLDDYSARFERLHRHIRQGDCYQGNLTFPVDAKWSGEPLAAFDALTARQPVRYAALASLGGPVVLSRSPELFFAVDRDGWIETHPMKGTVRRGAGPEEDERLKAFLAGDPKNQAENRMIVDLLRNDVSRISEVGTLEVPELFRIETYPTVHQMVSRVRAKLSPDAALADIFGALFPCGSVTGAPKMRAMEILRGLENAPRDVYCGAIGWAAPSGEMRFSVAIRTITLFPDGEAVYNVGGGVVFDSDAREEYAECLLKARFATGSPPASR